MLLLVAADATDGWTAQDAPVFLRVAVVPLPSLVSPLSTRPAVVSIWTALNAALLADPPLSLAYSVTHGFSIGAVDAHNAKLAGLA